MLEQNIFLVFRQFIGGICQKNQLRVGDHATINKLLYLKIEVEFMYIFSTFKEM